MNYRIRRIALAIAATLLSSSLTSAVTLSTSLSTPVVDQLDVANLASPTGGHLIWNDRSIQGQTFVSGSDWGGLNSITVQLNEGDGTLLGWKDYRFRFGTVSLGALNTISVSVDETVRQSVDTPADSYFTFTFDTPIVLAPNTAFGFDIGLSGSQNGWPDGIPQLRFTGQAFDGGQNYSGGRPATPGTDLNMQSNDIVFHADIDDLPGTGFLTLQADKGTGEMMMMGGDFADTDITYYQITSAGGSLNALGWNSFDDTNLQGGNWIEAGGADAHSLAEGLLMGSSTVPMSDAIPLGQAYDTSIDSEDLVFTYRTAAGEIFDGIVEYVTTATIPGDYDGDGDVDDADYSTWRSQFGSTGTPGQFSADGNNDGNVDAADYTLWRDNFTGAAPALEQKENAIPEPNAAILFTIAIAMVVAMRFTKTLAASPH